MDQSRADAAGSADRGPAVAAYPAAGERCAQHRRRVQRRRPRRSRGARRHHQRRLHGRDGLARGRRADRRGAPRPARHRPGPARRRCRTGPVVQDQRRGARVPGRARGVAAFPGQHGRPSLRAAGDRRVRRGASPGGRGRGPVLPLAAVGADAALRAGDDAYGIATGDRATSCARSTCGTRSTRGGCTASTVWRRDWAITPFVARDAREAVRLMRAQLLRGRWRPATGATGSPAACPRASSSAWRSRRGGRCGGQGAMSGVADVRAVRRTRRHPRPWQFDYLHLRRLLDDLRPALAQLAEPGDVVLDVFCGSRPYDDLVRARRAASSGSTSTTATAWPTSSRRSSCRAPTADYDGIGVHRGVPLRHRSGARRPRAPACRQARRRGWSCPSRSVWEYDRHDRRASVHVGLASPTVRRWDDVTVVENGGRAVTWTLVTGTLLRACEEELGGRLPRAVVRAAFALGVPRPQLASARLLDAVEQAPPASAPCARAQHHAHRRRPADG